MAKAEESPQIKRAREKLRKNLEVEHQHFTTEALQEMTKKIRSLVIKSHPEVRYLRSKKFVLFDENIHTAKLKSKQIQKLQDTLKNML